MKNWLTAFLKYQQQPNYCVVTSTSVSEADCKRYAEVLRGELAGTCFEAVDCESPKNVLPLVVPFERATVWPAQLDRQRLTFVPPVPKTFRGLGASESWFVDILSEASSGRAVKEAQLPESTIIPELLNGPCPPQFPHSIIKQFGDGVDSINARCSSKKEVVNLYIPPPEEVFEELLREHGFGIVPDEKRSSYLPTIQRFGSLHHAASAFSGQAGQVLEVLRFGRLRDAQAPVTDDGPFSAPVVRQPKTFLIEQIKSIGQFGKGHLSDRHYLDRVEPMFRRSSDRVKRVGMKRFKDYARARVPDEMKLESLLEHWADKSILSRRWEIGPCSQCRKRAFVGKINLHKAIRCPHCGHRVPIGEYTRIGYALNRSVRHSFDEGIVPVVLTGRFLRNLTDKGFFWLPGMKYSSNDTGGDIDLVACCDGHIVFGECKTMPQHPQMWDRITDQFLTMADVAIKCEASIAVLSAQVESFPSNVQERIGNELDAKISYLLLNNDDLQRGNRKIERKNAVPWLRLDDLLPTKFPERPSPARAGPRTINFGWAVYTKSSGEQSESEGAEA